MSESDIPWIVATGNKTHDVLTVTNISFDEDESNSNVDRLITEDFTFLGVVNDDDHQKVWEWTHPNGDFVLQVMGK